MCVGNKHIYQESHPRNPNKTNRTQVSILAIGSPVKQSFRRKDITKCTHTQKKISSAQSHAANTLL